MNQFIFFTALKLYSDLLHNFMNNIHIYDQNASSQIETLLQKGVKIRYYGYSLNYIMCEYDNLTIDVNGTKRIISYEMQIYLMFIGWNMMNNYLSIHKYSPIIHINCVDRVDVSRITFLDIITQFLDEDVATVFFK